MAGRGGFVVSNDWDCCREPVDIEFSSHLFLGFDLVMELEMGFLCCNLRCRGITMRERERGYLVDQSLIGGSYSTWLSIGTDVGLCR